MDHTQKTELLRKVQPKQPVHQIGMVKSWYMIYGNANTDRDTIMLEEARQRLLNGPHDISISYGLTG